ncbi:glycosyltransferase family 4 protein [Exiguobacterium sp. s36]|uniref:glycosyltransferase family 4 protein n=1 Tax=Exiguobacterium sp. s36 TaxID=2751227 RepID=UPI001BEC5BF2|nr:glycosyltransferase family 4 protein [Exiguobacterium sp. s36]
MNVLMLGSDLNVPGGITRVVKNYYEAGLGKKVRLTYHSTYPGKKIIANIIFFVKSLFLLSYMLFVKKSKFDLAHIHMSYKGSFVRKKIIIKILKMKKIPIILHMHGSQFKDFHARSSYKGKMEISKVLNSVDYILALGEEWEVFYKSISETKVISLNNSVFPKALDFSKKDKKYISTMGVLSERKGTYDLLEAIKLIDDEIPDSYTFVIAGNGDIEEISTIVKKYGLENRIEITGWISNQEKIDFLYRNSCLYILPSYNEGMPMSILEAMSYGIPIISTDVGSIPSVINKKNGILIKPGDVNKLAEVIKFLLDNENLREEMTVSNSKKICEEFNIYNSIDSLESIYKKIIAENKK